MKKILILIIIFISVIGCTTNDQQKYYSQLEHIDSIMNNCEDCDSVFMILKAMKPHVIDFKYNMKMRYDLLYAKAQNKSYIKFTNDSTMKVVAKYYKAHGTDNEQMLAYYLLGCVYRDLNEVPLALEYYDIAIKQVNVRDKNCDYKTLGRIHGQIAAIYEKQALPKNEIKEFKLACKYSMLAHDTISAIDFYSQIAYGYLKLKQLDKAINVYETSARYFSQMRQKEYAAINYGECINPLITQGKYDKVARYMKIYETESNDFEKNGNIKPGHELYYNTKGRFFLKTNKLDSAEYYFRKELKYGKDADNQNEGTRGLSLLYDARNMSDSAAKYALISYNINDSAYTKAIAKNFTHLQNMYDFKRNQKLASTKAREARHAYLLAWCMTSVIIIILLIGHIIFSTIKKKRVFDKEKYLNDIMKLEQAKSDLKVLLSQNISEFSKLISQKTETINQLENSLAEFEREMPTNNITDIETRLMSSKAYKHFSQFAEDSSLRATNNDWEALRLTFRKELPTFQETLNSEYQLREEEYNVCMLIKLKFSPTKIHIITGQSLTNLSNMRQRMLKKIFDIDGNAKDFDKKIYEIY